MDIVIDGLSRDKERCIATNFTLLQWRVVDGIERCSLKLLLRFRYVAIN
jgi:hypothetical protein